MTVSRILPSWTVWLLVVCVAGVAMYSKLTARAYEYEEVIYLSLDGSATVNVNASVAALVALYGAEHPLDPAAPVDIARVQAFFEAPGVEVIGFDTSRRSGRRFVHLELETEDVRHLARVTTLAGSAYELERRGETFVYRQVVPASEGGSSPKGAGWTGGELVAFRVYAPSRILFENATSDVLRGNFLVWEQTLADRIAGEPLDIRVEMDGESILYTTLMLFGGTVAAAAALFAAVIWWVVRRGRAQARAQAA